MKRIFIALLLLSITMTIAHAQNEQANRGLIPATPPVNVNTSAVESSYKGYGYLKFSVTLPVTTTPEFTLGNDESAPYIIGNMAYTAHNFVFVNQGKRSPDKSTETAWLGGILNGNLVNSTFSKFSTTFNVTSEKSGYVFGKRQTFAKRLNKSESIKIDYALTQMYIGYLFSGTTAYYSQGPDTYISDFDVSSYGIVYRPLITVQPRFNLGKSISVIPFVGAAAFVNIGLSSWELNRWEDKLYGADCFDGCPDTGSDFAFIPFEAFYGFDVEFHINQTTRLSLSSLFSAGGSTDTERTSEYYLVYSIDI